MLRFTVRGKDAPVKYIESNGGCGLVFTARVSRAAVVWILFVDVSDVCHVDKCLLLHKHAPHPNASLRIKLQHGSRQHVWCPIVDLKQCNLQPNVKPFLKCVNCFFFFFLILRQKTAFLVTFHWKEQIKTATQNWDNAVAIASSVSAEAKR